MFNTLAAFQRDIIRDHIQEGLATAKAQGRMGGRRRVMDEARIMEARELLKEPGITIGDICRTLGISRSTFYRYVHNED